MARRNFDTAETLVYDPVGSNRNATRASLYTLGFRKVEFASTLELLAGYLEKRSPDLVLCEVAGAESDVCDLIQEIRQGAVGPNPFAVIIATTWRRDGAVISQILNSGADDLLARPFSTAALAERLRAQIDRRKAFVVTSNYIGPDRRRDPGRAGAECLDVPNPLRMRTEPGMSAEEAERRIGTAVREGRETINVERMRRSAFQLCVQWRMLEQRRPGGRDFGDILVRIERINDEIRRRCQGTCQESAGQWCQSISASIRAVSAMMELARHGGNESVVDLGPPMHLLGHAALALGEMFAPGEVQPSQLVELDALVARIDVRQPEVPMTLPRRARQRAGRRLARAAT